MNTAQLDFDPFTIHDRTGRDVTADVLHSDFDGQAIAGAVEHAARIGHVDVETMTELMNRDYHYMTRPGMPSDRVPGQTRKYLVGDLERIIKSPRFRALLKQAKAAEREHEELVARQERERVAEQARFDAEIKREKQASPHLWAMVEELRDEIAMLRGDQLAASNLRSPLLRG
jgi:hypothetical protein